MDLKQFFEQHPKVALGFSGGVDSSYLLYAAAHYGAQVQPYFIKTAFQPEFELEDAKRLAGEVGIPLTVIEVDILEAQEVADNPKDRCYPCKKRLFGILRERAAADGYTELLDGTNASDDAGDRPGMKALTEMQVYSPLRDCGLTKDQIRQLSKEAGLFTFNKPAYACLATRVPTGQRITKELLERVERSERAMFSLGFTDFRVRVYGEGARIQVPEEQMELAVKKRNEINQALKQEFQAVMLDLAGR